MDGNFLLFDAHRRVPNSTSYHASFNPHVGGWSFCRAPLQDGATVLLLVSLQHPAKDLVSLQKRPTLSSLFSASVFLVLFIFAGVLFKKTCFLTPRVVPIPSNYPQNRNGLQKQSFDLTIARFNAGILRVQEKSIS